MTSLLLLIVAARLLGGLVKRWGQPALLGEMLAGVLLGPVLLGWVQSTPGLQGVAELSMFFIILGAGLELDPRHVLRGFQGKALWTVLLGFLVPFASGLLVGMAFGLDPMRTLFLGLCISITALPVAVRILEKFGLLDSLTARLTLSSAVVSDILALLVLGVILSLPAQPTLTAAFAATGASLLKLAGLGLLLALAYGLLRLLERWDLSVAKGLDKVKDALGNEVIFGIAAVFVLAFSSVSENLGFHAVVGAFFGAMMLGEDVLGRRHFRSVESTLKAVSEGFLGPVFFAVIGLHFSLQAFSQPLLLAVVLVVAVGSKLLAGLWGGQLAGMERKEALGMGAILNGRGIMELVVAEIALQNGFIEADLFSILVLMGVLTTILSPLLYTRLSGRKAPVPEPSAA
jgi:Kef-type K+ transport system membrane component KefB